MLDPQGKAIANALTSLGFQNVNSVRQGKVIDIDLSETDTEAAEQLVQSMCNRLLANNVIEDYTIDISE